MSCNLQIGTEKWLSRNKSLRLLKDNTWQQITWIATAMWSWLTVSSKPSSQATIRSLHARWRGQSRCLGFWSSSYRWSGSLASTETRWGLWCSTPAVLASSLTSRLAKGTKWPKNWQRSTLVKWQTSRWSTLTASSKRGWICKRRHSNKRK